MGDASKRALCGADRTIAEQMVKRTAGQYWLAWRMLPPLGECITRPSRRAMETNHEKAVVISRSRDRASRKGGVRPLRLKSLLTELTGEDLRLGLALVDAATVAVTLAFDPANHELRREAAKVWAEIRSIVSHHLTSEDKLVLPWAARQPNVPRSMIERARRQHRELRGLAEVLASVSFEYDSDDAVATAAKALYRFAARLDDLVAGEELDLFPMLRHTLFAPAAPRGRNRVSSPA